MNRRDDLDLRITALEQATKLHGPSLTVGVDADISHSDARRRVTATADTFLAWLRGTPVTLRITIGDPQPE